ncbi:(2Fe-2S)-binding protein [Natronomonas halophila]|uniref:2Fe-2S iron-sulfur cluster-binding protein n=1 Tax=Natronomonas halophila TaxID=2747817 RepID=UPI0015B66E3C|nr:2Fe-2S iron-sulfur cluster-binding protein [Natronomonas halophila]QLD86317.1 (2Fe-2S)-binding protein [Natronomonas halophila]
MVTTVGIVGGAVLTLVAVVLHLSEGSEWQPREDISQDVLEKRAETVPETEFPEPSNRTIGGGGAAAAAVGAGDGEAEGELAEEEEDAGPAAIPDDEAETYEIEYVKEGATIEVKENETLLEAGEEEGWDLPYACREGQCISCAGHIADGGNSEDYVEHHTNQMLGEPELDDGYTLTCVAYPTDSFSLETGESP